MPLGARPPQGQGMQPRWRWPTGARVVTWPVMELVMSVAVQLVLTPLLLHRLGPQQFGVWIIVSTTLLASTALSLGASAGVLPVLSALLHRGDVAGARGALRWLYRRVAGVSLAVLGCVLAALAVGHVPSAVPGWAAPGLWPLVLATLAWMTLIELDNGVSSALKAQGRFDVAAQTEAAARLVQLALIFTAVAAGSPALVPVALSVAVTVAKVVVRLAAWRRRPPGAVGTSSLASPAGGDPRAIHRQVAITGLWVWTGALGSLAFNAFDRWFVGAWFGASTLAAYAICTQLAQLPHAVAAAAGQVLVPWSARLAPDVAHVTGHRTALRLLAGATALAAVPSLVLLPLLQPLLSLWISPEFAREHLALARGLTLAFGVLCLNVPAYFLLLGMGRARYTTVVVSVCGAVFVLGALAMPHDLSTFVVLKGLFAVLALALPVGCALQLRAARARAA